MDGRRAPALRFGNPRAQVLAGALCVNLLAVTGITNMPARCGGHVDRGPPDAREPGGRPRLQSSSVAGQPFPSACGRDDGVGVGEHRPARVVEVFAVMVVAEQDRIDRADLVDRQRWGGQLA